MFIKSSGVIECRADNLTYKCTHCSKWFKKKAAINYLKLYFLNRSNETFDSKGYFLVF